MQERIATIIKILDEKKAEDIKVVDMSKEEYFVSFVIITTSLGQKHTLALIEELQSKLKNEEFLHIESGEEWSVLDLGDIIIHIFNEELRKIYKIEDLLEELKKNHFIS
ncbi:MAG: ribosome silencing factor [Campylobacter sp.]|nr:ribosome silencing factor [Campylobacter sp.]